MNNPTHILLVEDLALAQKVAATILRNMGYKVAIANCGAKALSLLLSYHFDIILLDLDLPDLSGFKISEAIRGLERRNKHKIIIALTANSTPDLYEKCRRYGIDDYIIKPLTIEKARYMISKHLTSKKLA